MHIQVPSDTSFLSSERVRYVSFSGIVRGEFVKIARLFWWMTAILAIGFLAALLLQASVPDLNLSAQKTPLHFLYDIMETGMTFFRILVGIFLLILTSLCIGREYQYGTIRIVLARGVGRVQLLLAKLALIVLLSLGLVVLFSLITLIFLCMLSFALVGNLAPLGATTSAFWANTGRDLLAVVISMGATILLAAAMSALGRSLTFGISASLAWFPLDNVSALVLNVLAEVTHSHFWPSLSLYLLGPQLNRLPDRLLPKEVQGVSASFGAEPLVSVSLVQALMVVGAYVLIFLVLTLVTTWKRDIKE
ncbi:ABC transporter permease [Ktedonospora formicarum]|uniref:Uncharacterized protein n=1 Tax=Ktedonospora formicarum TaxID=2778364 RepID=A0A8J3I5I7_9CHLR|nr:ABC transporter permease [Ktedonospora formicarum]GHO47145.1 hypothetical protein KSX_53080 [Ktedonospora formicarum]